VSSRKAEQALRTLRPYLFTKVEQADLALEAREIQAARTTRTHSEEHVARLAGIREKISRANGNQKSGR
jgi:hypothetical protein